MRNCFKAKFTLPWEDPVKAAVIGSLDIECMGGGEANTVMFSNMLARMGYDVTYFGSGCTGDGNHRDPEEKMLFSYKRSAFRHDPMAHPYLLKTTRLLSLGLIGLFSYKKTRRMLEGFDIYYFANPTLLSRKLIPELQGKDKKIILANHGTFFEYLGNSSLRIMRTVGLIAGKFLLEPLKNYDNIVIHTQNSFQTEYYKKNGFDCKNIVEIPQHNINFRDYRIDQKEEGFSVAFLGRLTESKGIDMLIDVANMNPEMVFHVMGRGPMRHEIMSGNKHNNMVLHGFVTDEEKRNILSSCDAMIVPSVFESLSIASIEGLACGLPLVASDTAQGLRYIISRDSIFGKVLPRNANFFSGELERLRKRKGTMFDEYILERKIRRESAMTIFDEKEIFNKLVKLAQYNLNLEKYNEVKEISLTN